MRHSKHVVIFIKRTLSFLLSRKIINENDTDDVFKSIYSNAISNMQKNLGQDSGWIINSVLQHTINFSKYNPLADINYIEFPKEKEHPKKGFINIQNSDDNECFKWCLMIKILQIKI